MKIILMKNQPKNNSNNVNNNNEKLNNGVKTIMKNNMDNEKKR
jgi:hypothetical protein